MTHVQNIWTAAEVLKRIDDVTASDIKKLSDWCKTEENSIPQTLNDEQLLLFLHSCYNNLEHTKKCMVSYYSLKRKNKVLLQDRDIQLPNLSRALEVL